MHLSPRQLDRFFDLLDELLVFANRHLHLVGDLRAPIVGEEAEMKAALVCEMLWANREVIDEFVRVNPGGLPVRDLEAVAAWSDALVGEFTLVGHEDGYALMLHETGLYAVAGLDADLSQRLPQAPDILHAALMPFEGLIVTDGLEMGSGIPLNADEMDEMSAALARLGGRGAAVADAAGLRMRAAAHNRELRERELDDLLASVELEARQSREGERLPEGYHRGELAGLDEAARAAAVVARTAAALAAGQDEGHGGSGQEAAAADEEALRQAAEATGLDPGQLVYEQERDEVALNCADALAQMCGMMTLNEAYAAYSQVVLDVMDLERFVAVLMEEDQHDSAEFVLEEWRGQSYLMHFNIGDAYAREWVAKQQVQRLEERAGAISTRDEAAAAIAQMAGKIAEGVESELANLDDYRAHLLESHARTPRRPLDARVAEGGYLAMLEERPAVRQLRDFLDAHVPDGEDDFTYADRAVQELILHSIDSGDAMAFLDEVEQAGLAGCAEDPGLMMRLVENAYGALPSWELNGWSPQEAMERLMGRRLFYNARGEMLHPAPGDACPCGSGRPYSECHGGFASPPHP